MPPAFLALDVRLGSRQGSSQVSTLLQLSIEARYQRICGFVGYCPKRRAYTARSRNEEGVREANHAIGMGVPQSRLTAAQHYEPALHPRIETVQELCCENTIRQHEERVFRIVRVANGMRCEMHYRDVALGSLRLRLDLVSSGVVTNN